MWGRNGEGHVGSCCDWVIRVLPMSRPRQFRAVVLCASDKANTGGSKPSVETLGRRERFPARFYARFLGRIILNAVEHASMRAFDVGLEHMGLPRVGDCGRQRSLAPLAEDRVGNLDRPAFLTKGAGFPFFGSDRACPRQFNHRYCRKEARIGRSTVRWPWKRRSRPWWRNRRPRDGPRKRPLKPCSKLRPNISTY